MKLRLVCIPDILKRKMNIYYPFNPDISHDIFSDLDCGPRPADYNNYQKLLITDRCLSLLRPLMVKPDRTTQQGLLDKKYKRQEWLLGQTHRQISLLQYIGHIFKYVLGDPIRLLRKPRKIPINRVDTLTKKTVKILEMYSKYYCQASMVDGLSFEKLLFTLNLN